MRVRWKDLCGEQDLKWAPLNTIYKDMQNIIKRFLKKCSKKKLTATTVYNLRIPI